MTLVATVGRSGSGRITVQDAHQLAPELAYRLACADVRSPRHR
jgi:hypothetical protein